MEVVSQWEGGYRCRVSTRHHSWIADEPESVGGGDTGPTPTELLLASLATCFTMALAHVARRREVVLPDDVQVTVDGDHDGPRFVRIRVHVRSATGDPAILEDLLDPAARLCYVSNTLNRSPQIDYEIVAPG